LWRIKTITINNFQDFYYEHPDVDLACINVSSFTGVANSVFSRDIHTAFIDEIDWNTLIPGSAVSFIGYPEGRFDIVHNLPILRKGYIATLPSIDFNGSKQILIDAQVFPGSSGSPVFIIEKDKFKLIGVVTRTMIKNAQIQAVPTSSIPIVEQTIGLGIFLKVEIVKELLFIAKEGLSDRI
jgi:hypothetical protein